MLRYVAPSALLLVALSGCGLIPRGLLYTDTIQPLCKDMRSTGLGDRVGKGDTKQITLPTTRVDLSAEWDSRAIGDIARQNGISTVYGCDSRRQSYVLGIWTQDEVIIYGY
jgi:hypothetical protein